MNRGLAAAVLAGLAGLFARGAGASDLDEFKVKRREVFEFARKPAVSRAGDRVEIAFESKDYCDVTVAIENASGRIIRHLASGVLGPNAPEPLQKSSLSQTLVWDSKNDRGEYVPEGERHTVRVSLGLKPRFERTLYWSPYKRISSMAPQLQAAREGVYIYEGFSTDHVRLFGRDGEYVRTVYPFPAREVEKVEGLRWHDFPHGFRAPLKNGGYQVTLLTSGSNAPNTKGSIDGYGAHAMAVRDGKLALALLKLNRFGTEGGGAGVSLEGGKTSLFSKAGVAQLTGRKAEEITPTSMTLSPDGKWLYLAGYGYYHYSNVDTLHVVTRVPWSGGDAKAEPEIFAGKFEINAGFAAGSGSGNGEFKNAASVDCDNQGRVYAADFGNDRIQVFTPEGVHLKNIPVVKPAVVRVHRRTQEIYVFSWPVYSVGAAAEKTVVQHALYRLGAFDAPKLLATYDLGGKSACVGSSYKEYPFHLIRSGEVDSWSDALTVWIGPEAQNDGELGQAPGWSGRKDGWVQTGLKVLREQAGKLEMIVDFGARTVADVKRAKPPVWGLQKFAFDPKRRKLYIHEGDGGQYGHDVHELMVVDVETGKIWFTKTPFQAHDIAFDTDGYIYLRSLDVIGRYDPETWREVPWDYGEELDKVGHRGAVSPVISGLVMPSQNPVCAHTGGFYVSLKGHVVAACNVRVAGQADKVNGRQFHDGSGEKAISRAKPYQPQLYPGRAMNPTSCCLHVWDKHGKQVYIDPIPGMSQVDGVGLDKDDNIYVMATPTRVLDGKRYFNEYTSTLMRFAPGKSKLLSSGGANPILLPKEDWPARAPDLMANMVEQMWADGAQWFYGGVGFAGFNMLDGTGGCACRFSRFCFDHFARAIAPEPQQFGVAVVDCAGNLILRIGKYGNVEDGMPLVKDGGPANPRSIGGDEVALFHACYTGTDTDRRIFISDTGNGRILSVRLDYHAEERLALDPSGVAK